MGVGEHVPNRYFAVAFGSPAVLDPKSINNQETRRKNSPLKSVNPDVKPGTKFKCMASRKKRKGTHPISVLSGRVLESFLLGALSDCA